MSPECQALLSLNRPLASGAGDMWLCRRLGIVKIFNGHKRGMSKKHPFNSFHMYHWGKPKLRAAPADFRDNDSNSYSSDPATDRRETEAWEYIGNIFTMLPYASLAGRSWIQADANRTTA